MKKILLIVAVVACIAVAGTALAATQFNPAQNVTGTLTADTYLALSLDSCSTSNLELVAGDYTTYTIDYDVTKSEHAPNGRLTITLAAIDAHNLNGVSVELFTDQNCTIPLKLTNNVIDENGTAASLSGAGSLNIQGLTEDGYIYARFHLADNAEVENIGGTMTLNLVEA